MTEQSSQSLSIIVPALNEAENIRPLIERIGTAMASSGIEYQIIIIDDHSDDSTVEEALLMAKKYPVECHLKIGRRGKAFSIMEGVNYVKYGLCAMIDADLQYPPEALPEMVCQIGRGFDIVVANRFDNNESALRKFFSWGFHWFFSRFLHGIKTDTQSGLKVFKAQIAREVMIDPTPWTFDLEFLIQAQNFGYKIGQTEVSFSERQSGQSKMRLLRSAWEIGANAIALKFKPRPPLLIRSESGRAMAGAGIAHKSRRFITHTTLDREHSAFDTFTKSQTWFFAGILALFALSFYARPIMSAIVFLGFINALYFLDIIFNLVLVIRSLRAQPVMSFSQAELSAIADRDLPVYSILCPLYKEAEILPYFIRNIERLDWPKDKIDAILLLEEDDRETMAAAQNLSLPDYVRSVAIPHSQPKTKPKACNYGLSLARGEFTVIYDAEDQPDSQQLKKAWLGFQTAPPEVRCLQAKLNYFNARQNILTRLFAAEYALWFDVILPGLQSIGTSIPLGGTSNHFRTRDLLELEGWDPFNVTEDCDLGARLFKRGYRTAIIDSVTLEEANSRLVNWLRQRSRWIKGYMQTWLVQMRHPLEFARQHGIHAIFFQFIIGAKTLFMIMNPFLWVTTIIYFAAKSVVGEAIESLFPPQIYYISVFSFYFGNFFYIYVYMIGCARRGHWDLIKYVFFIPVYWIGVSAAAMIAVWQLITKPHYWEKTIHGLHLSSKRKNLGFGRSEKSAAGQFSQPAAETGMPLVSVLAAAGSAESKPAPICAEDSAISRSSWKNSSWTQKLLSGESLFVAGMMAANGLNFVYNAWLGRVLSLSDFAVVAFVNTLWYLAMIFLNAYGSAVNSQSAYLLGAAGSKQSAAFLAFALNKGLKISAWVSLVWIALAPVMTDFFRLESWNALLFFTPIISAGVYYAAFRGFFQGIFRFSLAAMIYVMEALSKLAAALALVYFGFDHYAYLSIPFSIIITAITARLAVGRYLQTADVPDRQVWPSGFYMAAILSNLSSMIFLSLDLVMAKHFLAPDDAGRYALLSLLGKMIFFLASMPGAFFMTYVNERAGRGAETRAVYRRIYLSAAFLVLSSWGFFYIAGDRAVLLLLGEKSRSILSLVFRYCLGIGFFTLANTIAQYHLARRHYIFSWFSGAASAMLLASLMIFHSSLEQMVSAVIGTCFFYWIWTELFHYFRGHWYLVKNAWRDLCGLFVSEPNGWHEPESRHRILIFNWRDTRHKYAGGAEIYIQELASRWAEDGADVMLFCGNDGVSPREEKIDNLRVIRRGGFYLVYLWAFLYYIFKFKGKYDVIVDCHNGIPFFTPLYAREKVVCLVHHIHQEIFRQYLNAPMAKLAIFMEKTLMPWIYHSVPFITVSNSSRDGIISLKMGNAGISVIHPGVDLSRFQPGAKSQKPLMTYLGRLKAYKSIHVLIRAFSLVAGRFPEARLAIAGEGDERAGLEKLAADLGLEKRVDFMGYVSDETKIKLLQSAWLAINPSQMEGWGITTIEANACATPVVAADVPGLRDSVNNNETGFLADYGSCEDFAAKMEVFLRNKDLRRRMGDSALAWSRKFDWNKSSRDFIKLMFQSDEGAEEKSAGMAAEQINCG